jgi:hypothetical protein
MLLPQVLQEIELRAAATNAAHRAAIAEAELKRLRWEAAMESARHDYAQEYRAKVLVRQSREWLLARELRGYLDAMDEAIMDISDEEAMLSAREWQNWAEQWVKFLDPMAGSLAMPVVPDPMADDLKIHLGGWSPYGPT